MVTQPTRMSTSAATFHGVSGSFSTITPAANADRRIDVGEHQRAAGLTSRISAKNTMNANAVQMTASPCERQKHLSRRASRSAARRG